MSGIKKDSSERHAMKQENVITQILGLVPGRVFCCDFLGQEILASVLLAVIHLQTTVVVPHPP